MLSIVLTILLFLIILSILVLVHECGHFFAARAFGVHVEEFGLGFPPRAKGWKRGKTLYSLNWLPLGGFVKLKGEQGESAHDHDSFASKKIWQRIIILAAGVAMNLVTAVVLLTIGFSIGMPTAIDRPEDETAGAAQEIQIVHVLPNSPADKAGMLLGDTIESVDGKQFARIADLQEYIRSRKDTSVSVSLQRGNQALTKDITPMVLDGGTPALGVGLTKTAVVAYPIHKAFGMAVESTWALVVGIFMLLGQAFRRLAFDGFVGPVGIATYTATAAQLGIAYVINLMAQLSVSLAVINILPIPALDGGRVLFALVEKVRGKSLRPALENTIHLVGFATLILLLVAVTIRDISHLLPS
ncbi:MAG: RIP metalloprotease RseP [Candidatus Uhrbacteria bacterium]|nr:RIP metalloprotease RseP [Candidatus Uhrbacteria bacterium]